MGKYPEHVSESVGTVRCWLTLSLSITGHSIFLSGISEASEISMSTNKVVEYLLHGWPDFTTLRRKFRQYDTRIPCSRRNDGRNQIQKYHKSYELLRTFPQHCNQACLLLRGLKCSTDPPSFPLLKMSLCCEHKAHYFSCKWCPLYSSVKMTASYERSS